MDIDKHLAAIKARCDADANYLDMPRREGLRAVHEFNVHARTDVPRLVAAVEYAAGQLTLMDGDLGMAINMPRLAAILAGEEDDESSTD